MRIWLFLLLFLLELPRFCWADDRGAPGASSPRTDAAEPTDEAADEAEARKAAERFLMVLERNPRRGTALDKVVAFHVDRGSLDELVTQLREKASRNDAPEGSGRAWLVVGLIEDSRGDAEAAIEAFERGEKLLPKNAVASYLLGQGLISLNRHADGAAALERAIQRRPAPTDLLEVFQTLGRVQQRLAPVGSAGQASDQSNNANHANDSPTRVWDRLEKLVPNDPRVPELIAKTLLEDGHWEAALPRFEALAKASKDPYRRSEWELETLDLRLKLGQTEKALADADKLLGSLKPEHWLFRETRRRVEEAFLAQDDVAGWIKHLEGRLAAQPGDIDAVVRLARALAGSGRNDDARSRLEAAIKVAPNSADLRLELIELLQSQQKFAEAISQYEQLDRIAPNNPDYVREWGLLVLRSGARGSRATEDDSAKNNEGDSKNEAQSHASRVRHSASIWKKLVEAKPKDAVIAAQVADWLAAADKSLLDDAAALLQKAVELEPDSLSHREQLGEVLDAAGKKDESLAAWREMAAGPRRSAGNLARLAEVLNRFGYRDETLTTIDAACELDLKSLELRFQQAELRRNWKQFESAMSALAEAAKLADTPETFDRVVQVEVRVLSEGELLTERIEELNAETQRRGVAELADGRKPKAESRIPTLEKLPAYEFFRLAKYLEAASRLKDATIAARKAVELDPKNGVFLQAAAKMLGADSQWLSAVEVYERLLKLDRRFRIDSLRAIAEMEQKLGRKDRALKSGRELLAAAPANAEAAEFVVDLCVHFGATNEALQILRRASRQNPADRRLAMKLVDRLMDSSARFNFQSAPASGGRQSPGSATATPGPGKTTTGEANREPGGLRLPLAGGVGGFDEAREVLWRVFEHSNKADDRAEVAKKLGELSVLPGEFAKLIARFERLRHERKLARDASLALINIHEHAGDTQQARRELDRLLATAPRDADLLKRAVALSETMGDLDAAIAQQQRLADVVRRREADEHLMVLLRRAGRDAEANALVARWTEQERDPVKVLREIDRILTTTAGLTLSSPGSKQADRQAIPGALKLVQQWRAREPKNWEFMVREALLLAEQFETEKAAAAVRDELLRLGLPDDELSVLAAAKKSASPIVDRVEQMRRRFGVTMLPIVDYGQARQIAIDGRLLLGTYWLDKRHPKPRGERPSVLDGKELSPRRAWDDVYWRSYSPTQPASPGPELVVACLALQDSVPDDPGVDWLILQSVALLRRESIANYFDLSPMVPGEPLDNATLDRLLASLFRLRQRDELLEWTGRTPFMELVAREFRRASRDDDLSALLAEIEKQNAESDSPSLSMIGWLIQNAARRNDVDAAARLMTQYRDALQSNSAVVPANKYYDNPGFVALWLQNLMARPPAGSSADAAKGRVLKVLDAAWGPLSDPHVLPDSNSAVADLIRFVSGIRDAITKTGQPNQVQMQSMAKSDQGWLVWENVEWPVPRTVGFPLITKAPECAAIRVLMQAHAIALQGGWSAELHAHLRAKAAAAEPQTREKYLALLGLTSMAVWENGNEAALPVMRELFDLADHQPQLQFDIAWFHQHHGTTEAAIDLFDQIETKDSGLRKEIEQRAVTLASKLGRTERVKLAAERLFGMKLEPQEELQLAGTLSGLGLHEQAEAIRMRLPQRAGNNLLALQQLMDDHSAAKRVDEACAVAEQIVRRTAPANPLIGSAQQSTFSGGVQARVITQTSVARTKALRLLGQHGRLEPMIAQAEQQFERSQSLKLFGLLAELYEAADYKHDAPASGQSPNDPNHSLARRAGNLAAERQAKLLVRLADTDAADPQFRLTLARALVSAGQAKLAVPHFLFAIERLPNATGQVLFEAEQILSELGHVDELARIVLKSKLSVNDQQRIELFSRIVSKLDGQPPREKLIIQLFDKAFREAPEFRRVLAERMLTVQATLSAQEEFFPLLRDIAVPADSVTSPGPTFGIDVIRLTPQHEIDSITRRVVELAASQKQLDEFAEYVEAALRKHPDWTVGGRVTLGRIRLKQGRLDEAKELLAVLKPERERSRTRQSSDGSQETSATAAGAGTAANFDLLACGLGHDFARPGDFNGAVSYYELAANTDIVLQHCRWFGKEPAMQRLAVRIVNRMLAGLGNADELTRRAGSPQFAEAAKILADIGQPYSAARLTQAMITRWQLPGANNSDGGVWLRQLEDRFANYRAAMKDQKSLTIDWLAGDVSPPVGANDPSTKSPTDPRTGGLTSPASQSNRWDIDLLCHVTGDSLATLSLDSPFVALLRRAGVRQPPDDVGIGLVRGLTHPGSPKSLGLAILKALDELNTKKSDFVAVAQLAKQATEDLKQTRRSRTAPAGDHPQLGLWLVARECLVRDDTELKAIGNQLADLAIEGAAQHFDPRFRWSILRERGELALKAGDKQLAGKLWSQFAEDVLRPRTADESVPMLIGQDFVWSANWPNVRLKRARELCLMSLHGELADLSLAVFRTAVRGPITPESQLIAGHAEETVATWDMLEPEWRAKDVAADAIFTTLLECVLPTDRPNDVFVFAANSSVVRTPTSERSHERPDVGVQATDRPTTATLPQSLALRVVELAVAEKRMDVLTKRQSERDKSATNPLALRLISLLLAQHTKDDARLTAELAKLSQHDWSKPADHDGRIATHVVTCLMPLADTNKQAAQLLDGLVPQLAKSNPRDEHPLADLRRWQLRQQLAENEADKAKESLSTHLRHMDQVWSAAGAMDGQHLKRLELLTLAADFAAANLTRESLDLLAQVADARWPDKFPDENPGKVIALLEAKLKPLPAQERYELWRTWTLPGDGLKSMRMPTGAEQPKSDVRGQKAEGKSQISDVKSQISKKSELKSTGLLLAEAAREAKRLPELAAVVEQQMKQRPNDRLHVLLALILLAEETPSAESVAATESLLRHQLNSTEPSSSRSTTRTRIWDDWMLSQNAKQTTFQELTIQLAKRAQDGARELGDDHLPR